MTLLAAQVGVTLTDVGWGRVVEIGVEIPDAWAIDAHVVAQSQVGGLTEFIAQTGRWHKVVEVLLEVGTRAQLILYILQCVLVAQSQSAREFLNLQSVAQIGSKDVVTMLVV